MESLEDIRKQLNGLVNGIRECNFIPFEDKKDIVQNTWVKIVEKMNQGVIVDDFKETRGYTFQILRNFCLAYQRDKDKRIMTELTWDVKYDDGLSDVEYKEELISIVKTNIQAVKYKDQHRELIKLLLDNKNNEEIRNELNLSSEQLKGMKHGVVTKLKYDLNRTPKYVIKHLINKSIFIKCYNLNEVKIFLSELTNRQIQYMIHNSKPSKAGFYIEVLVELKRTRLPK